MQLLHAQSELRARLLSCIRTWHAVLVSAWFQLHDLACSGAACSCCFLTLAAMTKHLTHQPRQTLLTQRPPVGHHRPLQPPCKGPQAARSQGRTTNGHLTGGHKHFSEWTTSRLHPVELLSCRLHRCAAARHLSSTHCYMAAKLDCMPILACLQGGQRK